MAKEALSAEDAYTRAEEIIAEAAQTGAMALNLTGFSGEKYVSTLDGFHLADGQGLANLTVLPPDIAKLDQVKEIWLSDTQITDLTPLAAMTAMQSLYLSSTQVADLRPIKSLSSLTEDRLWFRDIPATKLDPKLAELSEIGGGRERTEKTLAYLNDLSDDWPPQPEVPEDKTAAPDTPPTPSKTMIAQANFLLSAAPITEHSASTLEQQISHALTLYLRNNETNDLPEELQAYDYLRQSLGALARLVADPGQRDAQAKAEVNLAQIEQASLDIAAQLRADLDMARADIERLENECARLGRHLSKAERMRKVAEAQLEQGVFRKELKVGVARVIAYGVLPTGLASLGLILGGDSAAAKTVTKAFLELMPNP